MSWDSEEDLGGHCDGEDGGKEELEHVGTEWPRVELHIYPNVLRSHLRLPTDDLNHTGVPQRGAHEGTHIYSSIICLPALCKVSCAWHQPCSTGTISLWKAGVFSSVVYNHTITTCATGMKTLTYFGSQES